MKNLFTLAFLCLISGAITAQNTNIMGCAHDMVLRKMAENNPDFQDRCQAQHNDAVRSIKDGDYERSSVVYQIPVVFHVVWNTPEQNLSGEVIQRQLEILNEDFRRLNPNAVDTRDEFLPVAADIEVEFYLAEVDNWGIQLMVLIVLKQRNRIFSLTFFQLR